MEQFGQLNYYYGCFCLFLALVFLHAKFGTGKKLPRPRLPPGPWRLPVIGSLHHLLRRGLPHHTMRDLSLRHGPLMLLRICERVVFVVNSAEAAREVFMGHGTAFEHRPSSPGIDEMSRHGVGVIFAPYGERWRRLRRILVTELLSSRRVGEFRRIREEEAARLAASLASSTSIPGQLVNVDERLAEFVADSSVRAVFGDRLPDRDSFLRMVKRGVELSSLFDLRDLFPTSRIVRTLPRSRKAEQHLQEMFRLIDDVLRHHEERKTGAGEREKEQDMIDVLLRIQEDGAMRAALTPGVIRAVLTVIIHLHHIYSQQSLIWTLSSSSFFYASHALCPCMDFVEQDVFGAAIDTATTTLQWAMAELIANPRVMEKAQLEVRHALAGQQRVREAALSSMPYLKTVVKETLRLHPPAPFIPRSCLEDQKVQGYDVPKGTILVVNAWAISRDPTYWQDSEKFMPERFEGDHALDFKGLDFEFTPFGAGRRICPGITFAQANVEIALATLLYHFDWELPRGAKPEELDMTEQFGVTVTRKSQLLLSPIPRIPALD
ncbi:hypothetical protein EJB05_27486, partial [Eragrostis curvula]